VHSTLIPVTLIAGLAIRMLQLAMSMEEIILKFTLVHSSIRTDLTTLQVLLALDKHAFVCALVELLFETFAVGAVIEELSFVHKLYLPRLIFLLHLSVATGHPVEENSLNYSTSRNDCLGSIAVRLASNESSLVFIAVRPLDFALTIWKPLFLVFSCVYACLASVDGSISKHKLPLHLSLIHTSHLTHVSERIEGDISQLRPHKFSANDTSHDCLYPHNYCQLSGCISVLLQKSLFSLLPSLSIG